MKFTSRFALNICALALGLGTVAARADVVAVVSAKSAITTLNRNQVADIFLGKTARTPDGTQVVPIDQKEGSRLRDEFYTVFAAKSPAQLKAHWSKIIFTGRGKPPRAVDDSVAVRTVVAADLKAIGYIDRGAVDSSVRVLTQP